MGTRKPKSVACPVIFLDFWGTLDTDGRDLDLGVVKRVVDTLVLSDIGAKVVITSDEAKRWDTAPAEVREGRPQSHFEDGRPFAIQHLVSRGVPRRSILGCTNQRWDSVSFRDRASEIARWLSRHSEVTRFVIFDDLDLLFDGHEDLSKHFVRVRGSYGLTQEEIDRGAQILRGELA